MKKGSIKPVKTKAKHAKAPVEDQPEQDNSSLTDEAGEESKTLSDAERQELTGLEDTIRSAQKQFIAVGSALHNILEKKLYKEFSDFDTYCDEKWGFSGSHARRLIDAFAVINTLRSSSSPIGEGMLPRNEYQARILHESGEKSTWLDSWNKVLKAATQDPSLITGSLVKSTLESNSTANVKKRESVSVVVKKVLSWIEGGVEDLDSVEAAKILLARIEKALKKL